MKYELLVIEKVTHQVDGKTVTDIGKSGIVSLQDIMAKFDNLDLYDIGLIVTNIQKNKVIAIRIETRGYFDFTELILVPIDGIRSISAHQDEITKFPF